jgi:hypothetical protein
MDSKPQKDNGTKLHTPEPWKVGWDGRMYTVVAAGSPIAWFSNHHDAWRCVTCVNHCEPFSDRALDNHVIESLVKYLINLRDCVDYYGRESPIRELVRTYKQSLDLMDDVLSLTAGE